MLETGDHLLETFRKRKDEAFSHMTKVQAEANERRKLRRRTMEGQSGKPRLIRLNYPESIQVGATVTRHS